MTILPPGGRSKKGRSSRIHESRGILGSLSSPGADRGQSLGTSFAAAARGGLDACGRAAMAEQADVPRPDGDLEVGDEPFVVADLVRMPGLVDGAAHVLQAEDLEIEVEVAGWTRTAGAGGRLSSCVYALAERHDDPARQLGRPSLERDDPADDQLGRVATAVERPLDEADQVVLDQVAPTWRTPRARASPGTMPVRSSKANLAIRVSPERLFWTFLTGR